MLSAPGEIRTHGPRIVNPVLYLDRSSDYAGVVSQRWLRSHRGEILAIISL